MTGSSVLYNVVALAKGCGIDKKKTAESVHFGDCWTMLFLLLQKNFFQVVKADHKFDKKNQMSAIKFTLHCS